MSRVNVIDLFAGPGGLGEGFSAYRPSLLGENGDERVFKLRFSIEMDEYAHQTLLIRSFLRQFSDGFPDQYYQYYRGKISYEKLREAPELQHEWNAALEEVGQRPLQMGVEKDDRAIEKRISKLLSEAADDDKWIVIGGPPCQAFSSVGRVRNMAKPDYRQTNDDRIYAYIEYLKILDQVQPDCFVLENVVGMLNTAPDGERIFPTIHRQLQRPSSALTELGMRPRELRKTRRTCGYRIVSATGINSGTTHGSEYLVPIAKYGVPQDRRRVILIGIRDDISPSFGASNLPLLKKFVDKSQRAQEVSVGEVINDLPRIRSKISFRNFFGSKTAQGGRRLNAIDCYTNGLIAYKAEEYDALKPTSSSSLIGRLDIARLGKSSRSSKAEQIIRRKYSGYRNSLIRIRKMRCVPNETKALWLELLRESTSLVRAWEKRDTPADSLISEAAKLESSNGSFLRMTEKFRGPAHLKRWLIDPQLSGVRNHESREFKPSDLLRYFYFSAHAANSTDSAAKPNMLSIPAFLKPDHANVDTGHFSDRFRVQLREKPAKTITCHLGKDGHAFIHYDPAQCRALTVREAARLQTFPDNYIFCGPVSEQRKQVGNAVPPWFAVQLAGLVHKILDLGVSSQRKKIA